MPSAEAVIDIGILRRQRKDRRLVGRAVSRWRELEDFYRPGDSDMADFCRLERQRLERLLSLMDND